MTEPAEPGEEPSPVEPATAPSEPDIDVSPFEVPKFDKIDAGLPNDEGIEL
jgi:hypothetical protein